jgi:hypothetical protein
MAGQGARGRTARRQGRRARRLMLAHRHAPRREIQRRPISGTALAVPRPGAGGVSTGRCASGRACAPASPASSPGRAGTPPVRGGQRDAGAWGGARRSHGPAGMECPVVGGGALPPRGSLISFQCAGPPAGLRGGGWRTRAAGPAARPVTAAANGPGRARTLPARDRARRARRHWSASRRNCCWRDLARASEIVGCITCSSLADGDRRHGRVPWPGPHLGLAGRAGGRQARALPPAFWPLDADELHFLPPRPPAMRLAPVDEGARSSWRTGSVRDGMSRRCRGRHPKVDMPGGIFRAQPWHEGARGSAGGPLARRRRNPRTFVPRCGRGRFHPRK